MAWTVAVTKRDGHYSFKRGDGRELFCFKMTVVSDTSGSGDITLSTELTTTYGAKESDRIMEQMGAFSVHNVYFVPGTSTEEPTLTIDNEDGVLIFTDGITDGTVTERLPGAAEEIGKLAPPMTDAIIACETLAAAATKTATFYFWFIR